MALHEKIFLASGSWTCPAGVKRVQLEGCGGGGGGGGGFYTTNSTNLWLSGGSGGGGAKLCFATVSVTPGVTYDITIGAGGAGAAGGTTPRVKATDGGDTIFKINAGATLATFSGAGAGYTGGGTTSNVIFVYTLGGQSTKFGSEQDVYSILWQLDVNTIPNYIVRPDNRPHQGGFTVTTNDTSYTAASVASYGGPSDTMYGAAASFRGGAPSTNGTDSGTYRGGSSGGGGGAGAYGPGGQGANGGNANGSGQGANGGVSQASVAGGANTGAGGGGGGAPGCGSSNVGVASAGAAGGSGKLIIRWTT